jgi:hypothetical protein
MAAENLSFNHLLPVADITFQYAEMQNPALTYVSTLAFEARDPLTIIALAAEQLQFECNDADKASCLAILGRATLRVSGLLNQIIEHERSKNSDDPA